MTVSTLSISKATSGNGSTTSFPYDYKILEATDLQVIIRSATGAETIKATSTYTVTGVGADSGTIVFNSSNIPVSGETVVVRRNVPQTQAIDYIANDPFPAETHEEGLDRATMVAQQVSNDADRSIKISKTNTIGSTEFTVGATDRANKVLSFNASGELAVAQELGTFKGNSATTTTAAYVVRDIVKGTTTAQLNNIYICIQASPIGTALTNTAYWTLIVDAVSAATSAATATTKASEAAASATAAGNSETAAETAEGNAETAEAAAVAAKDLSVTAKTAAEAAFDSFDDRYLGAKSSAPSTDNDGNALLTGALYFNSSSNQIFNWTGSAWVAIKPTSSEQTNINALGASAVIADMAILATDAIVADMAILGTDAIVADMAILGTDAVVADMAILGTDDVVNDMNVLGSSATVTAMNLLGTSAVVTDMGILATTDVVADMNVLGTSDVVTDMNVLGTSANVTAMGLLGTAAVVEDLGILGTSAIVADMALLGTSANVSAMDVIGTSTVVANIATVAANVAGVNSFAERYRVGSSNPTSDLNEGDLFYNTTSNVVLFYNGSAWITIVAGNVTQTGTETLTNKTLTLPKINENVTVTSTATELNLLDGKTASNLALVGKTGGTDFTNSLLVGHATTGTLDNSIENTGIGIDALDALTSGDQNTAVGKGAGSTITSSSNNVMVGKNSAFSLLSGSGRNTNLGSNSGYYNKIGTDNVGVGNSALFGVSNQSNSKNTSLGAYSSQLITTGSNNIAIGYQAANNITSGDGNVVIGNGDVASATGDKQFKISDGVDGSVAWITGDSSGNLVTPGTITANSVVLTGVAADNSITLAKMAPGTDGNIISYDTSGNPVAVATGSSGQVLTSAGAGAVPSFQSPAGGGKVLQVIQTLKTDTESVGGTSFSNVSGLDVTITPSASNSKILITLSMTYGTSGGSAFVAGKLLRGSTVIGLATDIQGSCTAASFGMNTQEDSQTYNLNYTFLDSPSTTNGTTYKIQISPQRNGSKTFFLNRPGTTSDANRMQGTTTLTAMEISA